MIFSFWWTCLFSICCFLCWTCVCYLSFFVLGHVSFVWLFAGYFWDLCVCVCYLSFLHLGMPVVCLLVHLGFCFRFLILGILFCVCLNLFFDVFYLRQLFYLRDVSATCVMFLCLLVFTWACPSVSCSLWVFSMGRICISILAQVTHVWLIFFSSWSPFWPCGHWNLCRRSWPSFDLGHGCTRCVIAVVFYVFYCKPNLHWYPYAFCALFLHLLCDFCALVVHFLALFMHFLCTFYAFFMHFLCTFYALFYALFMRFLCALKKHFLCAF